VVGLPSCPLRERSPSLLLPLLAILTAWSGCRRASPALPILGELPSFSLTSHHGEPVSRTTLAQQLWVADFIFTRCGGICPVMTARLARLRDEVPASVAFVSFTVDPEHDTPEVLSAYAKDAGASGNWLFLTGSREALYALSTGGFKLVALEVPPQERVAGGDGPFLHSSKLVLVDDNGRLRGYYDSSDDVAVKRLVADIDALGREVAR
jgi:protein SCO1/2